MPYKCDRLLSGRGLSSIEVPSFQMCQRCILAITLYDLAVPLLSICLKVSIFYFSDTCPSIFIDATFKIAKKWNQN